MTIEIEDWETAYDSDGNTKEEEITSAALAVELTNKTSDDDMEGLSRSTDLDIIDGFIGKQSEKIVLKKGGKKLKKGRKNIPVSAFSGEKSSTSKGSEDFLDEAGRLGDTEELGRKEKAELSKKGNQTQNKKQPKSSAKPRVNISSNLNDFDDFFGF